MSDACFVHRLRVGHVSGANPHEYQQVVLCRLPARGFEHHVATAGLLMRFAAGNVSNTEAMNKARHPTWVVFLGSSCRGAFGVVGAGN